MTKVIAVLVAMTLAGCTSSVGWKREQLVCLGFCWEAETDAEKKTGTTIKREGKKSHE